MITILSTAALSSLTTESLASMDRAALRKLYREALGQPSDRTILDRSSEMRTQLSAAIAQVKAEAEKAAKADVASLQVITEEEAPKAKKARAPKAEKVEAEAAPAEPRASKWTGIVGQLWNLREGEEAVEVKIPVEKLLEMGLPASATKFAPYWQQNPPGVAAREMGLVTSLRKGKGEEGSYLLIRKA